MGMGTTLANFQTVGNVPVVMDLLKRSERLLDILEAVAFSILVEIQSAPVAFAFHVYIVNFHNCKFMLSL